jgi:hypothetical protein
MPGNRISSSVLAGLDYFWNPLVKHSLQTVPEVECIVMAVYKWMFLEQSYAVQALGSFKCNHLTYFLYMCRVNSLSCASLDCCIEIVRLRACGIGTSEAELERSTQAITGNGPSWVRRSENRKDLVHCLVWDGAALVEPEM